MERNFKILIESKEDNNKMEVYGTKIDLMNALANLSNTLFEKSNLSKDEIKYAIELGMSSEEELKDEDKKLQKELEEKLSKIFKEIFE